MNKRTLTRYESLLPKVDGLITPKKVRCYDNGGETADRYTIVFTGNYKGRQGCDYYGCSGSPCHPQGIGQHGWSEHIIDKPSYSHLGKKIQFKDLPHDVQIIIMEYYRETWELEDTEYLKQLI